MRRGLPPLAPPALLLQAQFCGQSMETITRDTDRDFFMSPQVRRRRGAVVGCEQWAAVLRRPEGPPCATYLAALQLLHSCLF